MTTRAGDDTSVSTFTWRGARWWSCRDGVALINSPDAPDWFSPSSDPHGKLVKRGRHRTVWRRLAAGVTVFAKLHEPAGWFARLKDVVGFNASLREFRALVEARRREVATVRPLAVGRATCGRSVLLTEAFDGATTLAEIAAPLLPKFDAHRRGVAARTLVAAVARVLADAHRAGFAHRDMHPENLLVAPLAGGRFDVRLVDLHGVRRSRGPVSFERAVEALAQLEHYFHHELPARVRLRFLFEYLSRRDEIGVGSATARRPALRAWSTEVRRGSSRHADRLARQRDRRLTGDNAYFLIQRFRRGWRFQLVGKLARQRVLPVVGFVERTGSEWTGIVESAISPSSGGLGGPVRLIGVDDVLVDWSAPRGPAEQLHWTLFGSPARRQFLDAHRRRHRDQPGELLLGIGEQRRRGIIVAAVLLHHEPRTV